MGQATHEDFLKRCFDLAIKGLGHVAPNPMVGAVVVHDNQVIGEGYHPAVGEPHAEVFAIQSVTDQELLRSSTLYVNLEPCNHFGRTPPCTELILKKGVPRVVIGQLDPNPKVAGKGVERLRKHGVEVITDICRQEALFLNRRFNTFYQKNRPYILLKWAQSDDGFLDHYRTSGDGERPVRITDETCQEQVHQWRSEEAAILVGSRTVELDNPRLNVRYGKGRDPVRITLGTHHPSPITHHFFDQSQPTFVFTNGEHRAQRNLEFIPIDFRNPVWPQVFKELYHREIQSILVEGGAYTLQSLIEQDLWDEARFFTALKKIGRGVKAPFLKEQPSRSISIGNATIAYYLNVST